MFDAEAIHAQIPSNIEPNYHLEHSMVELSTLHADGNWAEGSTESASMIEFLAQGSIKAEPPWFVPLPVRKIPDHK